MHLRLKALSGAFATATAMAFLASAQVAGQAAPQAAAPKAAAPKAPQARSAGPRTPDGHPDFTGIYDLGTLTPVERPGNLPAILTDAEAAKLEQAAQARRDNLAQPLQADRTAPPKGGDGSVGAAGNVGGYNNFWLDPGSAYVEIDGQKRTSLVIDPPDGRVPQMNAAARQRMAAARNARPTSDAPESTGDPGLEPGGAYDDPERRGLAERCILGFGSTSGPPILPNYFYNNLHQIVQTKDQVMILTEMVHDARVVRMNAQHVPPTIRKWLGDSIGRWEGDTLVIETTNFSEKTRFRGSSPDMKVTERISRIDDKTLRYRFTIEDPATWDRPWTGEYTWPSTDDKIYEYACHEGNYALPNILKGARLKDAEDAAKKSKQQ